LVKFKTFHGIRIHHGVMVAKVVDWVAALLVEGYQLWERISRSPRTDRCMRARPPAESKECE
jgi:hypothetical protein